MPSCGPVPGSMSARSRRLAASSRPLLWMARAGCAWRLVPDAVGSWNSVVPAVRTLAGEGCLGGADGSSGGRRRSRMGDARQHRGAGPACAAGAKKRRRASAWPLARRLLQQAARLLGDSLGNPLAFTLTAGQQGDAPQALPLLDRITAKAVIADKAYDTDAILQAVAAAGAQAVIPPKATRIHQRPTDWHPTSNATRSRTCSAS